jgi:hypothetical protein
MKSKWPEIFYAVQSAEPGKLFSILLLLLIVTVAGCAKPAQFQDLSRESALAASSDAGLIQLHRCGGIVACLPGVLKRTALFQ